MPLKWPPGATGDSYDNALAESVIGLYKTEVIRQKGPWCGLEDVEIATLEWVWWFNHHRLLKPLGYFSSAEFEEAYYSHPEDKPPRWYPHKVVSEKPGAVHSDWQSILGGCPPIRYPKTTFWHPLSRRFVLAYLKTLTHLWVVFLLRIAYFHLLKKDQTRISV